MSDHVIEALDELPADIEARVRAEHEAFEAEHGVVCNHRPFAMVLRTASGEIAGALTGYSAYAEIYVDDVWVDAGHRSRGYGCALMAAVEGRFAGHGYNNINLVTNAFQAAGFYKKCGYRVEFVRENPRHPKLTKIFLVKFFDDAVQMQGIMPAER